MTSKATFLISLSIFASSVLAAPSPVPLNKVKLTKKAKSQPLYKRASTGTLSLINAQSSDGLYMGEIEIGTPGQKFTLQFDTGSSDLWVNGPNSNTTNHPKFDSSASSSFHDDNVPWFVQYGDGDTTTGFVGNDTVSFAGFTVQQQGLALANVSSQALDQEPEDGLMGWGYQNLAADGSATFFENLLNGNQLQNPYFSFFLQRDETLDSLQSSSTGGDGAGGELCIGCIDNDKTNGDVKYYDVKSKTRWAIDSDGFTLNNTLIPNTNVLTDIDTGSSAIIMPTEVVQSIGQALNAEATNVNGQQYLEISCDDFNGLGLGLQFGGTNYPIAPIDLLLGSDDSNSCVVAITAQDETDDDGSTPLGIAGDAFLKNVVSVYTYESDGSHKIGFAPSKQSNGGGISGGGTSVSSGNSDNGAATLALSRGSIALGLVGAAFALFF